MSTYQNNTDINDALVSAILAFTKPDGVVIERLVLRNKKRGKVLGNWGKYFPASKTIVLIVPRKILPLNHIRTPHSRVAYRLGSRIEWLVMILAHELRHAYQWQVASTGNKSKEWKEVDAEMYELEMLDKWRSFIGG